MKFFSRLGEYEACGMFGIEHLILFSITIIGIGIALHFTVHKKKEEIKNIIKYSTIILWILEIIKIVFNIMTGNGNNPNTYIPLYFCSLILYAGLFSSFAKGKLKRVGDIFLATGGIVAGITFIISPLTSLSSYPMFHFISIHSFFLHGTMIYIGLLMNISNYVEYNNTDIKYYFGLIVVIGVLAYITNLFLGTNLMFVSRNYPGTFIEIIYKLAGPAFPVIMILGQATLPFFIVNYIKEYIERRNEKYIESNTSQILSR